MVSFDPPARFQLSVESTHYPDRIDELSRGLYAELREESALDVAEVTRPAGADERSGEVAMLGQFALTFLTTGAFDTLLNTVRGYFERDKSLRFKLTRPDGQEIEFQCADFDSQQLGQTLKELKGFVD